MYRAEDMPRFRSGAGYQPLLIAEAAIPADLYAALISIRDMTASHAYGPEWRTVVRELSVQITRMQPGDDRGDHNDPVNQGEFISSYTAQGSCDIRLCYTTAESPPVDAPRSVKSPHRQQMVRRQEAGWYYSMHGLSLGSGTYHGVCAHAQGRLSVTFRFAAVAADAPSASSGPVSVLRAPAATEAIPATAEASEQAARARLAQARKAQRAAQKSGTSRPPGRPTQPGSVREIRKANRQHRPPSPPSSPPASEDEGDATPLLSPNYGSCSPAASNMWCGIGSAMAAAAGRIWASLPRTRSIAPPSALFSPSPPPSPSAPGPIWGRRSRWRVFYGSLLPTEYPVGLLMERATDTAPWRPIRSQTSQWEATTRECEWLSQPLVAYARAVTFDMPAALQDVSLFEEDTELDTDSHMTIEHYFEECCHGSGFIVLGAAAGVVGQASAEALVYRLNEHGIAILKDEHFPLTPDWVPPVLQSSFPDSITLPLESAPPAL